MKWSDAQNNIRARVTVGTDLNTPDSNFRIVKAADVPIRSRRYNYRRESGFVVPIGQVNNIKIPWSMLEECFAQLKSAGWYDGAFFQQKFPLQAQDHPCHVHVVGQIFKVAALAKFEGHRYKLAD